MLLKGLYVEGLKGLLRFPFLVLRLRSATKKLRHLFNRPKYRVIKICTSDSGSVAHHYSIEKRGRFWFYRDLNIVYFSRGVAEECCRRFERVKVSG
jgi:hypothetical protein